MLLALSCVGTVRFAASETLLLAIALAKGVVSGRQQRRTLLAFLQGAIHQLKSRERFTPGAGAFVVPGGEAWPDAMISRTPLPHARRELWTVDGGDGEVLG